MQEPATAWRVNDAVLARHARYADYKKAVEIMFEETDDEEDSKWIKISAKDSRKAAAQALGKLVDVLTKQVNQGESGNQCHYACRSITFISICSLTKRF